MLLKQKLLDAVAAGREGLVFARWRTPALRLGAMKTAVGTITVEAIDVVEPESITEDEARAAGHPDRAALLGALGLSGPPVHRARLRLAEGADPAATRKALERRLDRHDRAGGQPWTRAMLRLVAARPGTGPADMAAALGTSGPEIRQSLRKLEALGLVTRDSVGYRLSTMGAMVAAPDDDGAPAPLNR
ncbi:MAG: hypothetical protein PHS60_09875 [Zavarzinia sp.]|nr:hypothetical protein [Zavarzinia sp.]